MVRALKNPRAFVPLALVVAAVGALIFWRLVWPAFVVVEGNEQLPVTGSLAERTLHPTSALIPADSLHRASGQVRFVAQGEQKFVSMENVDFINGPDLHVYLATDINDITGDFIDLGAVRGNKGSFNYEIPTGTDLAKYRFVVHWCVPFRVLFNHAELQLAS